MHRCSSRSNSQSNPGDFFHISSNNSLSMVFPSPHPYDDPITSSPASSVDCTLSLGTPSTRQSNNMIKKSGNHSFMSNLCWGGFQAKRTSLSPPPQPQPLPTQKSNTTARGCTNHNTINTLNGDPLVARRCANCDTSSTPLWRNGPGGPKSLCNACGIRFKKEERRATTTSIYGGITTGSMATAPTIIEPQHLMDHHQHAWAHNGTTHNELRFMEGETTGVPFLSWHLNVPDRASLVQDYTF